MCKPLTFLLFIVILLLSFLSPLRSTSFRTPLHLAGALEGERGGGGMGKLVLTAGATWASQGLQYRQQDHLMKMQALLDDYTKFTKFKEEWKNTVFKYLDKVSGFVDKLSEPGLIAEEEKANLKTS